MRLYSFAALIVFSVSAMTQTCFTEKEIQALLPTLPDLSKSTKEADKAAAASVEGVEKAKDFEELRKNSLTPANLAKGKDMDFTAVDEIIKRESNASSAYSLKMAMAIAAGKPQTEINALRRNAFNVLAQPGESSLPPATADFYQELQLQALSDVLHGLQTSNPGYERVRKELCLTYKYYSIGVMPRVKQEMGDPETVIKALPGVRDSIINARC